MLLFVLAPSNADGAFIYDPLMTTKGFGLEETQNLGKHCQQVLAALIFESQDNNAVELFRRVTGDVSKGYVQSNDRPLLRAAPGNDVRVGFPAQPLVPNRHGVMSVGPK